MHQKFKKADRLSKRVIGAAIEVHRVMGPGLIESIYQKCLIRELQLSGIHCASEVRIPLEYKGAIFDEQLKMDVYVDDCLILELKAVESILPIHKAQILTYMKLLDVPVGLLINFHSTLLKHGISRLILAGADKST
ncbi:GxxExxY protein [bacterium]|nr:GxxExxY protein [bacterium]MCI0604712.1 GxxExxY protein [bacterium]